MGSHSVEVLVLVVTIMLAATAAAAETALTALTPGVVRALEEGGGVGKAIAYLKKNPNRFLSTILIVNSTSLIVASSAATLLFTSIWPGAVGELAATAGITVVVLIFSEITPKNLAVRQPQLVSTILARPVRWLSVLLSPIIRLLSVVVSLFMRVLGQGSGSEMIPTVTSEELMSTITLAEQSGTITEEETERIEGIVSLDTITAGEVMKPRVDMVAVPASMTLMEALDVVLLEGHSRIPVYEDTIDQIVGILYDKDLLKYIRENQLEVSLPEIAREAIFVPESKRADDLLREFQRKKVHMAIVVDEYGGTAGLVTIEDLLEEIVGEIQDEYDVEGPLFERVDENTWVFDAMLRIEEVNEEMGIDLAADNGVETLGGYVFERLGEVPEVDDEIREDGLTLTVVEVEGKRIKQVRIHRLVPQAPPGEEDGDE